MTVQAMTMFQIHSVLLERITASEASPAPNNLSAAEVRICFAGHVSLLGGDGEQVELVDAPIVGLLVDLTEAWSKLEGGAGSAEFGDFYGEYRIVLSKHGTRVRCTNVFNHDSVFVDAAAFHDGLQTWSAEVFAGTAASFAELDQNSSYLRLKEYVVGVLRERQSGLSSPGHPSRGSAKSTK